MGPMQDQTRNILKPNRTEQVAAPAFLRKTVRCNCTGNCGKNTINVHARKMDSSVRLPVDGTRASHGPIPDASDSETLSAVAV